MEGQPLSDLFKGREAGIRGFQQHMKTLMDQEGLAYGERTMIWNSRLAQELGAWADTRADGEALHKALYRAYFVDNLNIGDIPTLVSLARRAGLDAPEAERVLIDRSFREKVDNDWRRAAQTGITGVPTFVSEGLCVVGCQSYDILMRFVNHLRKLKSGA